MSCKAAHRRWTTTLVCKTPMIGISFDGRKSINDKNQLIYLFVWSGHPHPQSLTQSLPILISLCRSFGTPTTLSLSDPRQPAGCGFFLRTVRHLLRKRRHPPTGSQCPINPPAKPLKAVVQHWTCHPA
jgi:hypothetical protein